MEIHLQTPWQKLNDHTDRIFSELKKYPEDILQKKPNAQTWSASQNIVHLINAERKSLEYMQKKINLTELNTVEKAGWRSSFRLLALRTAFALPGLKFKAPSYIEPLAIKDLKTLQSEWSGLRKEYQNFLDTLPQQWAQAELWKHQRAGKMSVKQMLIFFTDHVDRHAQQINRTLKQVTSV